MELNVKLVITLFIGFTAIMGIPAHADLSTLGPNIMGYLKGYSWEAEQLGRHRRQDNEAKYGTLAGRLTALNPSPEDILRFLDASGLLKESPGRPRYAGGTLHRYSGILEAFADKFDLRPGQETRQTPADAAFAIPNIEFTHDTELMTAMTKIYFDNPHEISALLLEFLADSKQLKRIKANEPIRKILFQTVLIESYNQWAWEFIASNGSLFTVSEINGMLEKEVFRHEPMPRQNHIVWAVLSHVPEAELSPLLLKAKRFAQATGIGFEHSDYGIRPKDQRHYEMGQVIRKNEMHAASKEIDKVFSLPLSDLDKRFIEKVLLEYIGLNWSRPRSSSLSDFSGKMIEYVAASLTTRDPKFVLSLIKRAADLSKNPDGYYFSEVLDGLIDEISTADFDNPALTVELLKTVLDGSLGFNADTLVGPYLRHAITTLTKRIVAQAGKMPVKDLSQAYKLLQDHLRIYNNRIVAAIVRTSPRFEAKSPFGRMMAVVAIRYGAATPAERAEMKSVLGIYTPSDYDIYVKYAGSVIVDPNCEQALQSSAQRK